METERQSEKSSLTEDEIWAIIDRVVRKQMYDSVRPQEREELVNEAWLGVMEAQRRQGNLSAGVVYVVASRHLMKWKVKQRTVVSIPLNSAWWWGHKQKRVKTDLELKDFLITIQNDWKDGERQKDLRIVTERILARVGWVEQRVLRAMIEGRRPSEVWRELKAEGIKYAKKRAFGAVEVIRQEFRKELEG